MKSGRHLDVFLDNLIGEETTSGDLVRSSRNKLALTQEDVKKISGLEVTTQSAIENNKIAMTQYYAELYSVIFGQHPVFFLYPNGFHLEHSKELRAIKKKTLAMLESRKETTLAKAK